MMNAGIIAVASGLLHLSGGAIQCAVTAAPVINVIPRTADIRYDFSLSSAQLTAQKSDAYSPYAPGTQTVTEGLREDRPTLTARIAEQSAFYPDSNVSCFTYRSIDIYIDLQPTIFIASEWPPGRCRDTILGHEQKHIHVDREVMNEFAQKIGVAVQRAVDEVGAVGPVGADQSGQALGFMKEHVESAMNAIEQPLYDEMRRRQAAVDSLEEYERVGAICGHPTR
jgi:hypothetical protein